MPQQYNSQNYKIVVKNKIQSTNVIIAALFKLIYRYWLGGLTQKGTTWMMPWNRACLKLHALCFGENLINLQYYVCKMSRPKAQVSLWLSSLWLVTSLMNCSYHYFDYDSQSTYHDMAVQCDSSLLCSFAALMWLMTNWSIPTLHWNVIDATELFLVSCKKFIIIILVTLYYKSARLWTKAFISYLRCRWLPNNAYS